MSDDLAHPIESATPTGEARLLHIGDVPGGMVLKEHAGWNQTPEDWLRLLELAPSGCFGIDLEGRLAATTTVLAYERDLAWVGMVLTLPEARGRGLASRLMRHAIHYAEQCGLAWLGLDATSMGIGVYRRFGFEPTGELKRWSRPASATHAPAAPVQAWSHQAALDRRAFGADRSALLEQLARIESACIDGAGYAMGRPGSRAAYFGPCVAASPATAETLLRWYVARHADEQIYWDILADNRDAEALARSYGFEPARTLTRMLRPVTATTGAPSGETSLVYATAGLECG